jgi:hypothetical protein
MVLQGPPAFRVGSFVLLPVAQALLPVRTLQKPHRQECLCYLKLLSRFNKSSSRKLAILSGAALQVKS